MLSKKKIIVVLVLLLTSFGAFYVYSEFKRTRQDSKSLKESFTVTATGIGKEFIENESAATKKYAGNELIISVNGRIKDLRIQDPGAYAVILGDSSSAASVVCLMDSVYEEEIKTLTINEEVTLKGRFNGFKADELGLGADVELNLCVIVKK